MCKLVFYTGAGMSRESGLPTFRGKGGLWDTLNIEAVAARSSWYCGRRSDCLRSLQSLRLPQYHAVRGIVEDEVTATNGGSGCSIFSISFAA